MEFQRTLEQGIFVKRYKRFFADINWNKQVITAHVPNTGSMLGCSDPGQKCYFSISDNPERKLKYTLEIIQAKNGTLVGVNTQVPNKIVKEALTKKQLSHWKNFNTIGEEIKISPETRIDFVLSQNDSNLHHYIEVKNVSLVESGIAKFPDAITSRGQKHIRELLKLIEKGHGAEIIFVIQRNDCNQFMPAIEIDKEYAKLFKIALDHGLKVTPIVADLNPNFIYLTDKVLPLVNF